ncbi:hypothetical protein NHL50_14860 [Acidimicrobiia bacterium EGI L10123]|uniref:hypothetical protein n=1 Tax=Salinilacustrithrix flava TaxID=2957203 RepID=UPI003D7C23E1|nr:hypothetical protein [Acidimicrobiia bacterium EGI L10123]
MSVVRVEHADGVRVIHVEGCATDDDLREALSSLRDHAGPTVLDLAELTLVGPGVAELVAGLVDTCGAVCVTARRHTARVILQRSGIGDLCVMFASVGDALQALRLAEAGYGAGWSGRLEAAR